MRKALLVVNGFLKNSKFDEIHAWLVEAASRRDILMEVRANTEIPIIPGERTDLPTYEFILFWDKDVRLAWYLEQQGFHVYNSSEGIRLCDDKSLTHLALSSNGIKMPRTILAPMTFQGVGYTNYEFVDQTIHQLGLPFVMKECFGSFGAQVYLIHSREEVLARLANTGVAPVLFQEYIKSSFGRDIRLNVVGDQVVAAMYRYSDSDDFRANISNGGKMKSYEPTKEQSDLAVRCCKTLGLDFAGVDLLFGEYEEPIVCEVNSNAHFKNIFDCTGINVADAILEYILERRNCEANR